ncbi:MAG: glycosyltransferase family 4 protein, partial [Flavobacteriia bacterium]
YCTTYISTIRESSNASIILRSHNVEFKLWEQLSRNTRGYLKKSYLKRLAKDLKQAETQAYSAVDQLFSISESDKKAIEKLGVKTSITTIPVAMDLQPRKVNDSNSRVCFIGSMNWQPNLEAVNILVNELFPRIKENLPSTELHLAGSYMNGQYPTDLEINLINHDFAEDMQVFLRENGVMVLPIRSGSGVRVKILEALSLGIPIVTTPIGALGITDQSALIIGETDEELIQKTLELLHSQEKRKAQGLAAWNYIHSNYGIEQISTQIAQLLNGEQA